MLPFTVSSFRFPRAPATSIFPFTVESFRSAVIPFTTTRPETDETLTGTPAGSVTTYRASTRPGSSSRTRTFQPPSGKVPGLRSRGFRHERESPVLVHETARRLVEDPARFALARGARREIDGRVEGGTRRDLHAPEEILDRERAEGAGGVELLPAGRGGGPLRPRPP